jgi:hypothetical protein
MKEAPTWMNATVKLTRIEIVEILERHVTNMNGVQRIVGAQFKYNPEDRRDPLISIDIFVVLGSEESAPIAPAPPQKQYPKWVRFILGKT